MAENNSEKGFNFQLEAKSLGLESPSQPQSRRLFMAHICLRVLAIVFTATAIPVMVTASQPISLLGAKLTPSYSQSSSTKFLLGVDATVCACSVLSLIYLVLIKRSGSQLIINYFNLFLHDFAMSLLMISGCAAATAVGYLSKYGQAATFWAPFCNIVSKFCHQILVSTVLSYLTFFCYMALVCLSFISKLYEATQ